MLDFEHDAFKYGWEPDGSHQIWDNVANRRIVITGADIQFEYFGNDDDYETDFDDFASLPKDRKSYSDPAKVSHAIIEKLSGLEKSLRNLYWVVGILLVIVFDSGSFANNWIMEAKCFGYPPH